MRLTEIAIFPVKSAAGIRLQSAAVETRGLAGDRRWMIVDAKGRSVTQRDIPALARLRVELLQAPAGLRLAFEGEAVEAPCPAADAPRLPVRVWSDRLVLPQAVQAGEWLSRNFGRPLRLFHQPDDARRPVDDWADPHDEVSLADAFPVLIATAASLAALREQVGQPLGMERFRPNLVIEGAEPWAEDTWARIRVGTVELDIAKPCGRCTVTTIDQARGEFTGEEPLATLRRIRMSGDRRVPGVLFGWNAVPRRLGTVEVGDQVEVLATRAPWPIRAPADAEAI